MSRPPSRLPWWATDLTDAARSEGYAEGSDQRLAQCLADIAKHMGADVSESVRLHRIGVELGRWRWELAERGRVL